MSAESLSDVKFEIGHVLFIDIVGYSKLMINEQTEQIQKLREIVRGTEQFRFAEAEGKLLRLPTGDGGALVFRTSPESPVLCALEISKALRNHPELRVRMGIHSGPVNQVTDLNEQSNIAGAGINIAQRVMDCGDAGHILLSKRVADDLEHYPQWRSLLYELGECEVKHGQKISVVNMCDDQAGNPQTPEKFKTTKGAGQAREKSITKFGWAAIALAVIAVGFLAFQFLHPRRPKQSTNAVPSSAVSAKSVAVLAFANLSDDKGNEYFSDGISEELLTVLQKIPGLHVAARTSAFSFKGKNATAQEIGQKLGVAHLVEGSVRKAGDVVRIAARLTRTDTGEQLWSENFTRDLKDVFAVQTELAQTIVGQLSGQLTGGTANPEAKAAIRAQVAAAEKGGTKNVDAHQHYLQGRFYANLHSEKGAGEALAEYQRAVELDPSFALAWAGLAQTHAWYCGSSSAIGRAGFDDHLGRAREAAARALAIEPNLPEALLARSKIQLNFDFDWNGAAETVRSALSLAPADPALVTAAGSLALARGDTTRAIELYRQAVALDPVNPAARSWLAFNLAVTGRFDEARAEYPRVVELSPAAPWSHAGLGLAFIIKGKFDEAAVAAQDDAAEFARLLVVAMARWSQKRIPEADVALARLTEGFADTAAYQIAEVHAYRGEKDRAFEWLERARGQRDGGLGLMRCDPFLANLREDPRWNSFLHTMGLADDQLK